jgi:hypothetical protein
MSSLSYEQFQRGPFIGNLVETSENSFYFGTHPLNVYVGGRVDGATRDSGNTVTDVIRPGLLLGMVASTGKLKQWSATATDGSQFIFGILDNPGVKMQAGGADQDRFRGTIMIRGLIRPDRLLIGGNASYGISGNAYEYMIRKQLNDLGFMVQEDSAITGLLGYGTQFGGGFRLMQAKTADYTVKAWESGTLFTTRGAAGAVNFTLPATPSQGLYYGFYSAANQNLKVTAGTADTMVAINDLAADSVSFETASLKIGGMIEVYGDGTGWLTRVSPGQTSDGTASGQIVTVAT